MTFKTSADMFAVFAALPNLVPDMQPCLRTASYLLSLACSFNPKSWQTYPKSILLDGHLLFPSINMLGYNSERFINVIQYLFK